MPLAAEEREHKLVSAPVAFGVTTAVAAATFLLARQNGGYDLTTWSTAAVLVWWTVALVAALELAPSLVQARSAAVPAVSLGLFAAWTGLSATWAASAEDAYVEFARVGLYLGVFVLGAILPSPRSLGRWRDGLALGIAAVGLLALVSRLFPGSVGSGADTTILPILSQRLNYPMGYWNGLGILVALGLPLLLSAAVEARTAALRGAAIGAVPPLAAAMYLTSSRGAVATAAVGVLALLVATPRRWPVAAAAAVSAVGVAVAVSVVASRHALTAGARGSDAASQGHTAAVVLTVVAVAVGAGWLALQHLGRRLSAPSRGADRAVVAVGLVAAGIALLLSHPLARFDSFRRPPAASAVAAGDPIASHLLSVNGSGRWQFWQAAVAEFRSSPLRGRGAGSYEAWWAAHGSLPTFVRDAHSLYLETLGELGLVGFLLLATFVVSALVIGVRSVRRERDPAAAAILAAAVGFLLSAGIDWMWELTAVGAVGVLCLGLVAGSGAAPRRHRPHSPSRVPRIAIGTLAVVAILAQAPSLLSQLRLDDSQAAAAAGRLAGRRLRGAPGTRPAALGGLAAPPARARRGAGG